MHLTLIAGWEFKELTNFIDFQYTEPAWHYRWVQPKQRRLFWAGDFLEVGALHPPAILHDEWTFSINGCVSYQTARFLDQPCWILRGSPFFWRPYGGFLKWGVPQTMVFKTKSRSNLGFGGTHIIIRIPLYPLYLSQIKQKSMMVRVCFHLSWNPKRWSDSRGLPRPRLDLQKIRRFKVRLWDLEVILR